MKVNLVNIETEKTSTENLQDEFFGLDPRKDILHRVVTWQLSRKRSGTRKTKITNLHCTSSYPAHEKELNWKALV